jgi:hypothetical protein
MPVEAAMSKKLTKKEKDTLRCLALMAWSPGANNPIRICDKAKDKIDKLMPVIADRVLPRVHRCALCSATTKNMLRDGWVPYGVISSRYRSAFPDLDGPVCSKHNPWDGNWKAVFRKADRILRAAKR